MIGYPDGTKGFKLWDVDRKTMIVSCHVRFDESGKTRTDLLAEDRLRNPPPNDLRPGPAPPAPAAVEDAPPPLPPLDFADDADHPGSDTARKSPILANISISPNRAYMPRSPIPPPPWSAPLHTLHQRRPLAMPLTL